MTHWGFKNVYHKEEYGLNKKFYDDSDFKKYHSDHDHFDSFFKAHKGGSHKGGEFKVRAKLSGFELFKMESVVYTKILGLNHL